MTTRFPIAYLIPLIYLGFTSTAPAQPTDNADPSGVLTASQWELASESGNLVDLEPPAAVLEGGTLTRLLQERPTNLNPIFSSSFMYEDLHAYINRPLARRNREDPDVFDGELSYRVEANEDHTEFHVWLRSGVVWHPPLIDLADPRYAWLAMDHELSADDFIFMFEVLSNEALPQQSLCGWYSNLTAIEAVSEHEIVVRWSESSAQNLALTLGLTPLPRWLYAFDEDGSSLEGPGFAAAFIDHWYNDRAIGVGPYRLAKMSPLTLTRWDRFYGDRPPITTLEFWYALVEDSQEDFFEGNIDMIAPSWDEYESLNADGMLTSKPIMAQLEQDSVYHYIGWNHLSPLFSDATVRTAMTHALDRKHLIRDHFEALAEVVTGPFLPESPGYDDTIEPFAFDLERAAELLTEAGWVDGDDDGLRERTVDGVRLNFAFEMLVYAYDPRFIDAMESYRADLQSIGVEMTLVQANWEEMLIRKETGDFQAYTGSWLLAWETDLYPDFHSSQLSEFGGRNYVGFQDELVDALLVAAQTTLEPEARAAINRAIHQALHDAQPFTFFFVPYQIYLWHPRVQNVSFSVVGPPDYSVDWRLAE